MKLWNVRLRTIPEKVGATVLNKRKIPKKYSKSYRSVDEQQTRPWQQRKTSKDKKNSEHSIEN